MKIDIIGKAALERWGLAKIVSEKIENAEITSLSEFHHETLGETLPADIVILCLSQLDTIHENLAQLRAASNRYSKSRILVWENVSSKHPFLNLRAYLSKGFDGYVTSLDFLEVFEQCLNRLSSGKTYICPDGVDWLLGLAGRADREAVELTRNELDIAFRLLEGLSISQIARDSNRKASTISTIKKNILRKTNTKNVMMLGKVLNFDQKRSYA
ncbi:DNA-binding NarL/FixJ family response regulator [Dyadobacter sp. BE34]|uniref:DNA-binding NarL/FixJ family response regulator n=1 Tax=Dyadobacter fermentans TaxID=94254 RepID=A0ABU1R6A1_9BACT|nr:MULTISPECIES: LuxR C-terminal-related transcriptional regulator [Dyadobacter]MDR6808941.1 DNA-binding NarL/FixJ family response regulator [Dyadobacter fermentans]MDR7046684.1 DNA-binding NarL/FixJ family response regulator [Dyadobacter sp. BE242]MDR7200998.1 DNA-binding NarL/FixJ family response regulator [Dyadobacter sp. BE34]MDR7218958.1 DNA-binding NarL/FixJ family response regulator [Dyadobacter sp. BE31]MDR7264832.1 DNA-binding NarL/FixJ family response regulator [Dyadobacter sp. BE32]